MNNTMRGIVPTAKPKPKPAAPPPEETQPAGRTPAPAAFDPKLFLTAMSTVPTSWSQLSIGDKLFRVMAYLPKVKDTNAIASAIADTDAYVYRITSPHGPMLQGAPVGKAAPTVVSPVFPQSTVDVDPRQGIVTDVPQKRFPPPTVGVPKPLVVFDPKSGKLVMPSGMAPARQADSGSVWGYLLTFGLGMVLGAFSGVIFGKDEEHGRR